LTYKSVIGAVVGKEMSTIDEGGKQLGALVIAIVVVVALIAIAKLVFGSDGVIKTKVTEELNKVTSSSAVNYVQPGNNQLELGDGTIVLLNA